MVNFLRNLDKLSEAGFKVISGTSDQKQDVKAVYKGFSSRIEGLEDELMGLQSKLDAKETRAEKIENRIQRMKKSLARDREKKGLFVRFTKNYKMKKKVLQYLKGIKRQLPKEIKEVYRKIKMNHENNKEAQKDLKEFEKCVNKFARDHKDEIQFILYYKKHKAILYKAYSKEQIDSINHCIGLIQSGQEWAYKTSVWESLKQLKNAVKSEKRFHFGRVDRKVEYTFGPAEEDKKRRIQEAKAEQKRRDTFQGNLVSRGLSNSVIVNRQQLEYVTGETGLTPEQHLLIAGVVDAENKAPGDVIEAVENGTVAGITNHNADYYMNIGCDLLEKSIEEARDNSDGSNRAITYAGILAKAYINGEQKYKNYIASMQQQQSKDDMQAAI